MREILWRAINNDWFEYPAESQLLFFQFPARYATQALEGVRVMYTGAHPTSMERQPQMKEDVRQVLQKKIKKMINKGYIAPSTKQTQSLIKYFAVPKGVVEEGALDWRIVYQVGANKLNDVVWAPSFSLQTVNLLLRVVDKETLMMD